jgi:glycosyltransferase involved in cell wall biosynthesis
MRILIPSVQTPFIKGGAFYLIKGLKNILKSKGHEVEIVTLPFKFFPDSYVSNIMDVWKELDFNNFNGYEIDKVIVLQFPAYYVKHKNKVLWLMHQHRAMYDLYDETKKVINETKKLRKKIIEYDNKILSEINKRYTISNNVSNRLLKFNKISSIPIYHPPFGEQNFYCEEPYNYIFCLSRLEELKRQHILINAMKYVKSPVKAVIAGEGGQKENYKKLIETLDLQDKVKLVGNITENEKYAYYARSLAVFFCPYDEDYGYITLEGMLSRKPVITCKDSGCSLEFIQNEENGFIIDPDPISLAERIDWLYFNKKKAKDIGISAYQSYKNKNISWDNVVNLLLK